jgi:RNA polymerase sigma-70 factor (TIGR02960 family)
MVRGGTVNAELIRRARAGDEHAFRELVEPHRHELQVHCYRILGSAQDAEDALQETLLAAWRGLTTFEGRSSMRTWLYRIATNRCLNALRSSSRRPPTGSPLPGLDPPPPTRLGEVVWLEPYPDILVEGLATDEALGPEARYASREAISLAFVTALQHLPPLQRAVLVLRDVLGFHASEVARILDTTEESVTSALKRARSALRRRLPSSGEHKPPPPPNSAGEQELIERLTHAYDVGDVESVVALLTDDVWLKMPPMPLEYQGRELAAQFLAAVAFRDGRTYRLVPTRANGQPAFGAYVRDPHADILHATLLLVVTLSGNRISAMTAFPSSVLARFGLPRTLPG